MYSNVIRNLSDKTEIMNTYEYSLSMWSMSEIYYLYVYRITPYSAPQGILIEISSPASF